MKKIYFDWNIINRLEDNPELFEFILQNQSHFVFVYSPAHFSDLMKSYKEGGGNIFFEKDLERLESVCETHLMRYFDKKLNIHRCSPREFLEKEGKDYPLTKFLNSNLMKESLKMDEIDLYGLYSESLESISFGKTIELPLLGSFSNALEFFSCCLSFIEKLLTDKDFVRTFRTSATNNANDKKITNLNGYNPNEVIGAINAYIARQGVDFDLEKIIKVNLVNDHQGDEKLLFESLYASLDLMKYHPDKRDLMNILTDADHAFYGSFCDVLVTDDAKMRLKAEAVYSYFGIETKIINKHELLDYLVNELSNENNLEAPLRELFADQHVPKEYEKDTVYGKWIRLENPYFSFFNKIEYRLLISTGQFYFVFTRELEPKKYVYFTEIDKLFQIIKGILHRPELIEAFEKEYVEKYNSNDCSIEFVFNLSSEIILVLGVSENNNYPLPIMYMLYTGEQTERIAPIGAMDIRQVVKRSATPAE